MALKIDDLEDSANRSAIWAIIERAQAGDKTALPDLRSLFEQVPSYRDKVGGNLAWQVEQSIVRRLGGEENLAFREAVMQKLLDIRKSLEGPSPTAIECLLIDRIVACWLQVQEADLRCAQAGECTVYNANYLTKRQDRAHRRFLSAIKSLVTLRKLATPILQVNIGEKQVNLGVIV